jgi:MoxR-like ATPase
MTFMVAAPLAVSKLNEVEASLNSTIRGKPEVVRLSLVCLLARGHLLVEDVPGVGKTTLAQSLARAVHCKFHRLQFTSDMLPSDVLGVTIYNAHAQEFEFKQGPVFTNFLLADEINRATPKTQSALLEAMNEVQVTIESHSPVEHHGTYPLPESQLDRFLMRIRIGYPDREAEREILRNNDGIHPLVRPVLSAEELLHLQEQVSRVSVDDTLVDYMLAIVEKTRSHESLALGVSPRGAQALYRATQAMAMVEGRDYIIPDDIKRLVIPVFAHRIAINARASLAQRSSELTERILQEILTLVEVPL